AHLQRTRRTFEVRIDRRESRRYGQRLLHRRIALHRFLSWPARAEHESFESFQVALARGSLLEGRCRTTSDATHLRHRFLYAGRDGRLVEAARGGRKARSSPARPGTRPVFDSGKLWTGPGAVAPEGGNCSPADGGLSPRRTGPTPLQ